MYHHPHTPVTTAAAYYAESFSDKLFERELVGRDDIGRSVYQKFLSGKLYGYPRALRSWAEYKRAGPTTSRWCSPYFRNDAPAWML